MRRKNWRLIIVGLVLIGAAGVFFLGMSAMMPNSNDPVAMMQTVGQVAGAAVGIGFVMFMIGLIGKKA